MIWHPRVGQHVEIRYRPGVRGVLAHHGRCGTISRVARGPGPISAEVLLDTGMSVVVPRGNLVAQKERPCQS